MAANVKGSFIDRRDMKVAVAPKDAKVGQNLEITYTTKEGDKSGTYPILFVVAAKADKSLVVIGQKLTAGTPAAW